MLLHTDRYETFGQDLVQLQLPGHAYNSHICGYVTPSGTVFSCEPYGHMSLLESFFLYGDDFYQELYEEFQEYRWHHDVLDHSFGSISLYDEFALAELGWVKIAAYGCQGSTGPKSTWQYDFYLTRCTELTPEQIAVIYPV